MTANLDNPLLMEIFQQTIRKGLTNVGLEKELKPAAKATVRKKSFSLYCDPSKAIT